MRNIRVKNLKDISIIKNFMQRQNSYFKELLCDGQDNGQISIEEADSKISIFITRLATDVLLLRKDLDDVS